MTRDAIAAASNRDLIARLAELANATLDSYHRRGDTRQLAKERAWIWQEFAVRRRDRRLRMTPNRIRGLVSAAQLDGHFKRR